MRTSSRVLSWLFLSLGLLATALAAPDFHPGRILARPKATTAAAALATEEARQGVTLQRAFPRLGGSRILALHGPDSPAAAIRRLRESGLYDYVEPDYVRRRHALPNDPKFLSGDQWGLRNTGLLGGLSGADIDAPAAWDIATDGSGVLVGILDTGIRATHEDLKDNLWSNPADGTQDARDDDANGYVDDLHGANFTVDKGDPASGSPKDDVGHGTAVASVIGAVGNNGKGLAGVAWKAKLVSLKWDDREESAFTSRLVAAIDYAIAKNIRVLNISYGGPYFSQAEFDALKKARDAGIIVVVSAGNDAHDNDELPEYPANHALDNLVVVAASNRNEQPAGFSNFGSGSIDLFAPGEAIPVCKQTGDSDYDTVNGTSFAAPQVAGSLALLLTQRPTDSYRKAINRVLNSVDRFEAYRGKAQSGGRLNLAKALASTTNDRPFNDRFADAAILDGATITGRASLTGATTEAGTPAVGGVSGIPLLWFEWTAPSGGTYTLDLAGTEDDSVASVFTGSSLGGLTSVAANDDAPSSKASRLTFVASSGVNYLIALGKKAGRDGLIRFQLGKPPINDALSAAVVISDTEPKGTGTTRFAGRESGEPSFGSLSNGSTVWYRWTAPRSGFFHFIAKATDFDPRVKVFTGSNVSSLVEVNTTDSSADDAIEFEATSGVTYRIGVDGLSGKNGTFSYLLTPTEFAIDFFSPVSGSLAFDPQRSALSVIASSGFLSFIGLSDASFFNYVWTAGGNDLETPVFLADGDVVFADSAGTVQRVSTSGTVRWQKTIPDVGFLGTPAVGADGSIYTKTDDGKIRAWLPNGDEKWTARVPGISYASPTLDRQGRLLVGSTDKALYCLDTENGRLVWRFETDGEIYSSVALDSDDSAVFGTQAGSLYRVKADGTLSWRYVVPASSSVSSSPAIANGRVYFGAYDGKVYALNAATGSLVWTYTTGDEIRGSSPAVDTDGQISIGSYDGYLHVIKPDGTLKQKYPTLGAIRSSPLLAFNYLWWGSSDGFAYADASTGPAVAPWPMHRQNVRRNGRVDSTTAPRFLRSPQGTAVGSGGALKLGAVIDGQDGMTFQWYKDGVPISGATQSVLTRTSFTEADAGSYTLAATNALGTTVSSPAVVTFSLQDTRGFLQNLSVRSVAGTGSRTLIAGFSIRAGDTPAMLPTLARVSGPALAPFGLTTFVADPVMNLDRLAPGAVFLGSTDDWDANDADLAATSSRVGAFSFGSSRKDAALLQTFDSGNFTVSASGKDAASGVALIELYDASLSRIFGAPRFASLSARSQVGIGADVLIAGFSVGGKQPVKLLIRGSGPALSGFGVAGVLADPVLDLHALSSNSLIATNDDWGVIPADASEISSVGTAVGAFAWADGSRDAALVVTLEPGNYTATLRGKDGATGVGLIEVYEVP
ncbi:S8 family serine peptidase [Nibricoccus sp. IMCC34717]|uniref:S8 family serine peptidase n=1 Tax=Nibricoccus sp. IMCC34717 TaxID=3034021 RepID=UPI00384ECF34